MMDQATANAIISRLAPGGPAPQQMMAAIPQRGIPAMHPAGVGYGAGGGGAGSVGPPTNVGDLIGAVMRRIAGSSQQPVTTVPPSAVVPGPDRTVLGSPNDHIGLTELAQGSLLDQIVNEMQRGQFMQRARGMGLR